MALVVFSPLVMGLVVLFCRVQMRPYSAFHGIGLLHTDTYQYMHTDTHMHTHNLGAKGGKGTFGVCVCVRL